jgi:hypothetical protein
MKKEATSKCKGLKIKTSDEKRGNPKTQAVQIKYLRWKKMQPQNTMGSKQRHLIKKRGNTEIQGVQIKDF